MAKLAKVLSTGMRGGLEVASHTNILNDKYERRSDILQAVFDTQNYGNGPTNPINMIMEGVAETNQEDTRRASERYSLCSRLFARHIAEATRMESS